LRNIARLAAMMDNIPLRITSATPFRYAIRVRDMHFQGFSLVIFSIII
jgi:hypothetical protein